MRKGLWEKPGSLCYAADVYLKDLNNEEDIGSVSKNNKIVKPRKRRVKFIFGRSDKNSNNKSCIYPDDRHHLVGKRIAWNIDTVSKSTMLRHVEDHPGINVCNTYPVSFSNVSHSMRKVNI